MIIINGKGLAKNDKEFISSVFTHYPCVGYYKLNKKSISILDHQKNKVGVFCNGVIASSTKRDNGYWYSYTWPKILGIEPDFKLYSIIVGQLKELLNNGGIA